MVIKTDQKGEQKLKLEIESKTGLSPRYVVAYGSTLGFKVTCQNRIFGSAQFP